MATEALSGIDLSNIEGIYIAILEEHLGSNKSGEISQLQKAFVDRGLPLPNVLALETPTDSQPETVSCILSHFGLQGPFIVKDCDNTFNHRPIPGNYVCAVDIHTVGPTLLGNKSFVVANENLEVTNIVEKQVISSSFCCGGYSFESTECYQRYFSRQINDSSLYISHVIYAMLLDGHVFHMMECSEFADWGTEREWMTYIKKYATLFIDIDGVIVKNGGRYFGVTRTNQTPLERNVSFLKDLYRSGRVHIVLTSSRKEDERSETVLQLAQIGVEYHALLLDLPHCQRILINDYSATNPFPSSIAINIERDSDTLRQMLSNALLCTR